MGAKASPGIWFPTIRAGTGTDVFTVRLVERLVQRGVRAEIHWLPLRGEFAPWTVRRPSPPDWADLAHVNTWLPASVLPHDLPVVATIHHSMHHPELRPYKDLPRRLYHQYWIAPNERRILRRAARVCAVSAFVARTARRTLLDVPMTVVYNGVDVEEVRERRNAGPGRFRLLYAGAWRAMKGVDMLAPVMRELGDGFELFYTGNSPGRQEGNMRDIGRLSGPRAVAAAMRQADALLFPSRSEGFPLVVIEAMSNGLPVIAAEGSSLSEAVDDGVTGVLCARDDVGAFVQACRRLAGDPELHQRMSEAARSRASRVFSLDKMVDAYLAIYRDCVHV